LTGKYREGQPAPEGSRGESSDYVKGYMTPENYARLSALTAFAKERDHTINELAHAWLLAQPMVSSVISGASKIEHVQANTAACEWALTPEEFDAVSEFLG